MNLTSGAASLVLAGVLAAGAEGSATSNLGAGGLWMMKRRGARRDRQLDILEAANRETSERMAEASQGLRPHGEVLAELLRRTA